ncbi:epoxyqueuosine reductase [bacterium BMS3Bbin10]|nr:epoxyqueuosine reductase [bacterium BMS3Bbin10]
MPELKDQIRAQASEAGFDVIRFTTPGAIPDAGAHLMAFLGQGRHGDMHWMEETAQRRASPLSLWGDARSVIVLGLNYGPESDPLEALKQTSNGIISVYARGKDYHGLIKKKLKRVAGWLHRERGCEVKVFVDTAPVMEKPLAQSSGAGWQGKHTNLVSRGFGSWLFLGSIFTTETIAPDEGESDHCGACRACLDICPTDAFPAPYELDARRCISYLTIEHQGAIALEFRAAIGNRIFGCDDCLAVCPWNKFARASAEARLGARAETDNPPLGDMLMLDDAAFRSRFAGTPVKRTGRDRFIRNVLIAAGNSGNKKLLPRVEPLLGDASALVRAMAVWAGARLMDKERFAAARESLEGRERDAHVKAEWRSAGP